MNLKNYFQNSSGIGVISTADSAGLTNSAIYATPHVLNRDMVGFVMRDRRTRANLNENPHASYLYHERENITKGVRLNLKRVEEIDDQKFIDSIARRPGDCSEKRFFAVFQVTGALQLVGGDEVLVN